MTPLEKIAVLIPTRNRLPWLKESLASARAQTHTELEILVADDGSNDGTMDFLVEQQTVDHRIRVLPPRPRLGIVGNFNYLRQNHTSRAFCILADDDRLLPDYVMRLWEALRASPEALAAFCDHWLIDAAGTRQVAATDRGSRRYGRSGLAGGEQADPLACALRGTICLGFALYRADAGSRFDFDPNCGGAIDLDFNIRCARAGGFRYVNARLGEYRVHPGTITATETGFLSRGAVRALEKHRFPKAHHERERRRLLHRQYRVLIYFSSACEKPAWRPLVARYLASGGNPLAPRLLASILLRPLPAGFARRLKSFLHALKSNPRRGWLRHLRPLATTEGRNL